MGEMLTDFNDFIIARFVPEPASFQQRAGTKINSDEPIHKLLTRPHVNGHMFTIIISLGSSATTFQVDIFLPSLLLGGAKCVDWRMDQIYRS